MLASLVLPGTRRGADVDTLSSAPCGPRSCIPRSSIFTRTCAGFETCARSDKRIGFEHRSMTSTCTSRILNIAAVASMHGSLKSKLFWGCSTATKAPRVTASDCNHDLNITQELKYNNQSEFEARRLIEVILRCPTVRLHMEFITGI